MRMKLFGKEGSNEALGFEGEVHAWPAQHPRSRLLFGVASDYRGRQSGFASSSRQTGHATALRCRSARHLLLFVDKGAWGVMRSSTRIRTLAIALVATALVTACIPRSSDALCLRVAVGECRVEGNVISSDAWFVPPAQIRLDPNPPTAEEQEANWIPGVTQAVRPYEVDVGHQIFSVGGWTSEPDGRVNIVWSGGYGGVNVTFDANQLQDGGVLTTFSDVMGEPVPSCDVELETFDCK